MLVLDEKIQLRLSEDGSGYLNFWDYMQGNDVIAEVLPDGRLVDSDTKEFISFTDYVNKVKESVSKREE